MLVSLLHPMEEGGCEALGRAQMEPHGNECAAGCVKDGENIVRNELYHTLLLGMEVTVQQD